ncbi:MAG: porphobilinogen synthase [Candidatus Omnitrophica bacterium]|nr:porphobilinogen synthase [Candidatus Omnitrophota bacterium]
MKYPFVRLRRLREDPRWRSLVTEHHLLLKDLIQPLFIKEGLTRPLAIPSMPGQCQHSEKSLLEEAQRLESLGIPGIILFGIPSRKNLSGREAFSQNGVIQRSVQKIKKACKDLLVITDVCLCEYLSHGHCGHVKRGRIMNDESVRTITRAALSHARAGADAVAPSDMMDGRILAIRRLLDDKDFKHLPVISYAVKYASAFYAPFREAAESAPSFGDRSSYQMNPANAQEALREAQTDLEEGADVLLVKPALGFGDVIRQVKDRFACPVGCFSVSGEYSMIKAAAQNGWLDEKKTVMETHLSMKRAGANFILTYWAKELAEWGLLKNKTIR